MTRSNHQNTQAFRAGVWLGRTWRALGRREKRFVQWLIDHGCHVAVAVGLIWIVRLAVLGLLLYTSIIVAVFFVAVLLIVRFVAHANVSSPTSAAEWRTGPLGFGLYDRSGWRVDPHDPNYPFDEP